ncbi:MAG: hypothetical protein HGA31_06145 [Candidatus Moranbacteria bacterium]|nr:hypothetical protein [Candidatus Moranbacteria bacterium]
MMTTTAAISGTHLIVSGCSISDMIDTFLEAHGLRRIVAISGGLASGDTEGELRISEILHETFTAFAKNQFAVQSGGTKWGVPRLATEAARDHGMKTIGVYPWRGRKHALPKLLDFAIEVGPFTARSGEKTPGQWGDEAVLFATLPDVMVVFGGGPGAMAEVALTMKRNGGANRKTVIVPVLETGGIADLLPRIASAIYVGSEELIRPVRTATQLISVISAIIA